MTATVICRACGAQPRAEARFCDACGARIEAPAAEYKQVTVLFADVVRSMDLASTLDAERLREIMADLFDRSAAIVRHYGGTVDKFTGDGIMAVFGAPISLEDHAFRACLAALEIQKDVGATLQVTDRPEFGSGDRRRNRFQHSELYDYRRAGGHGSANGSRPRRPVE